MPFTKSITLSALLLSVLTAGSIAQGTTSIVNPDPETPVIVTTSPNGSESNVDPGSVIEITFSSDMDETSLNGTTLLLHATSSDSMSDSAKREFRDDQMMNRTAMNDPENRMQNHSNSVSGTISYSNKIAIFTPDENLKEGTQYTFTVTNGVKSSENIALENEHKLSFSTTESTESVFFGNQNDRFNNRYPMERPEGGSMYKVSANTSSATSSNETKTIDLGKAGEFVILAKEDVNNRSESDITGHIGEGSASDNMKNEKNQSNREQNTNSNQSDGLQANQSDRATTPDVSEAIADMMTAYENASNQNGNGTTTQGNKSFQNKVMSAGIHEWSESLHINSDVTISGSGDDIWIMMVSDDLKVDENTVITLSDGARAENIFWFVEGDVTIGKNAQFEGIILSMNEITLEKGAKLNGRMFSQTSISLDDNTIAEPKRMTGQTTSTNR